MTEEDRNEVKKMIKVAVDSATLELRQEIVNARRALEDKVQAIENKRNGK